LRRREEKRKIVNKKASKFTFSVIAIQIILIPEARAGLAEYFEFYNKERFHQSLDSKTPWQVYCQGSIEGLQVMPSVTEALHLNYA
jgi:hypothetical protein